MGGIKLSYYPANCGGHRHSGSGYILVFGRLVTLQYHGDQGVV